MDLKNWMSNLPSTVLDKSLAELAIPGTHDSFTYNLDPTSDIGPDVSSTVKAFGNIAKGIVYKWSVTQSQTFVEQLESGVRYFDLRVATRPGSSDVFFLHGLYGGKAETGLEEINRFLEAHSKEVVLIDFNHFYNISEEYHTKLIDLVQRVFGSKLCMYVGVENVTLNMMWENGLQVVALYHHKLSEENPILWPGHACIRSPWANTPSVPKLIHYLDTHYLQERDRGLHVCQGVLTPDTSYIMGHLSGTLKTDLAGKAMLALLSWLKDKPPGSKGVNICIADFTELSNCEFVRRVIQLNH